MFCKNVNEVFEEKEVMLRKVCGVKQDSIFTLSVPCDVVGQEVALSVTSTAQHSVDRITQPGRCVACSLAPSLSRVRFIVCAASPHRKVHGNVLMLCVNICNNFRNVNIFQYLHPITKQAA